MLREGWFIQAVLNNDMIGNIRGQNGVINNRSVRVFSEATRPIETPEARRWRRFSEGKTMDLLVISHVISPILGRPIYPT